MTDADLPLPGPAAATAHYLHCRTGAGADSACIVAELEAMGWHPQRARHAVVAGTHACNDPTAPMLPGPDLAAMPGVLQVQGRELRVQMRMHRPAACLLADFLSAEECEQLIARALPRLQRSMVIAGDGEIDEDGVPAYARTSEQASFRRGDDALADCLRERAAALLGWPDSHFEPLQVVRYRVGADFAPHHDYFCPQAHAALIAREGQRLATLLVYLNTPERGGATAFPDVELEITAQRGNALYFAYPRADEHGLTRHAGVPIGSGEKWLATFFLRDRAQEPGQAADGARA